MRHLRFVDPFFGWVVVAVIVLQALLEWTGMEWVHLPLAICLCFMVVMMAASATRGGRIFLLVCAALTASLVLFNDNWSEALLAAVVKTGFLASFFSALAVLREAASSSPAMAKAGQFLAAQPPGRRYISLSVGTQIYALLLNFGSIQLLGSLALASGKDEPDEEVRQIRTRRMLLAIQRGFISALPWSPMAFSTAMAVATIPGISWITVALPGLVTAAILLSTGWALDTLFKPKLSRAGPAPKRVSSQHRWTVLLPLAALLVIILLPVLALEMLLGIRVVGIVLVVVPLLSIGWLYIQFRDAGIVRLRMVNYVQKELPAFRSDLLLLMSAGYIGVVGSSVLVPLMARAGIDLTVLPPWLLLIALLWIMPVMGQLGGNPILTLALVAPLLPDAALFGLEPSCFAVAMLSGWALTGLTSPFTATNIMIGRFGGIPITDVGRVWNRSYFLVSVSLLMVWVLIYAYWIA
ncbi:hypothetical protein [uncultured Cohaesibacter sp.]|uniref:hypothetical protein n=1 Tax=uncultured Cohaesibacter sp. TaxID=1002546 RepID=UPI0029C6CD8E|nr:hypothetical protein [uncultured Cohaesibacter sp.]